MNSNDIITLAQQRLSAARGRDIAKRVELGLGVGSVHIDRALTNVAVQYQNNDYIADAVFPVVRVNKKSDKYFKVQGGDDVQRRCRRRGGRRVDARSPEHRPRLAGHLLVHRPRADGLHQRGRGVNADAPLQPRIDVTEILTNYLMLAREKRIADIVFGQANYGSNTAALSGGDQWNQSTSDPVANILYAIKTPTVKPNTMVIGWEAYDALRTNPGAAVRALARLDGLGATPLMVDETTLAAMFRLNRVIVGEAKYNTAAEGAAASMGYLWGKFCALIRVEPSPSPRRTQTFGYTMRFGAMETSTFFEGKARSRRRDLRQGRSLRRRRIVGGEHTGYLWRTVVS